MRRQRQLGLWPRHEALRLQQCADMLTRDAETATGPHGAYIAARTREDARNLKDVRSRYKANVNSHIWTHMQQIAAHVRYTADLMDRRP